MTEEIQTTLEPVAPDLSMLDVIGTLYSTDETPVLVPGWHVNSPWPVVGWGAYQVSPSTPRRLFAGVPTHCYTFPSEAVFLEAAATADLSAPPAVPCAVARRQARQALLLAGLLDQVQPAIDAIPDATQRAMVQIEWDDSLHFERSSPALLALAAALGITSSGLDDLFISAAAL